MKEFPPIKVVLPKQESIGPGMGVRLFSGDHEIHYVQDVELEYSVTDVVKARVVLLVSEVTVEERKHE